MLMVSSVIEREVLKNVFHLKSYQSVREISPRLMIRPQSNKNHQNLALRTDNILRPFIPTKLPNQRILPSRPIINLHMIISTISLLFSFQFIESYSDSMLFRRKRIIIYFDVFYHWKSSLNFYSLFLVIVIVIIFVIIIPPTKLLSTP